MSSTLGNIPNYCHPGNNENNKPYLKASERKVLFATEFIHTDELSGKKGPIREAATAMRHQFGEAIVPCFLDSEEFLAMHDPEAARAEFEFKSPRAFRKIFR